MKSVVISKIGVYSPGCERYATYALDVCINVINCVILLICTHILMDCDVLNSFRTLTFHFSLMKRSLM